MKNLIYRLAGSFGVLIWIAISIAAQSATTLTGRVVDTNGAAIANAEVVITRNIGRAESVTSAAADGTFRFEGLASGNYQVSVKANGFASNVTDLEVSGDRDVTISLKPGTIAVDVMVSSGTLGGTVESDELPGSISRLDSITLENSRVFNFSEALRKLPGLNVREEEGFGLRPNIGIRGTNPTRSSKVLLLEDGIPFAYAPYGDNASYYHPPVERFDSIEVLKGSSQIVYGPHTVAGVINYVTPNPSDRPQFSVGLTGGSGRYFNGNFTGSDTIGKTGLFGAYTRKQGEGSRENTHSVLNDFLAKVVQTLNDRNALTFKLSHYREDSNVTYSGLTVAEFAADPRANPFRNDFFYGRRTGFSGQFASVLTTNSVFTTTAYFNRFKRHWWRQSSNSAQRPNRLGVDPDCLSMADLNTTCGNEGRLRHYDMYGVEPRYSLRYNAGSRFRGELETGARFHWEEQDRRQLNGSLPTSRDGVVAESNVRRNFARSAFIQHRFIFGNFAITPGLRYENIKMKRINRLATPAAEGETTVDAWIPGIGISYSGLPRMTVFAGVHKGFSPPRTEDVISNTGGVVDLRSEESWNYEAGVRAVPHKGARLEATVFRMDYENQIVPASLAGGVGALLTNGGRTLHQGLELAGSIDSGTITGSRHNVYLRSALTWLPIAEFTGVRFSSITPSISVTGKRLPYTPSVLFTNSIGYSHAKGLDAFIENVYVSGQFSDDLNTVNATANGQRGYLPSQSYWNATANYSVEKLRSTFFVTVKNITDQLEIVDRSRGIVPSTGRALHAGVKFRFR